MPLKPGAKRIPLLIDGFLRYLLEAKGEHVRMCPPGALEIFFHSPPGSIGLPHCGPPSILFIRKPAEMRKEWNLLVAHLPWEAGTEATAKNGTP